MVEGQMGEPRLAPRLFLLAPKLPELIFLLPITDQLPGYWRYRLPTTKLLPASRINSQATDTDRTTNWETKTLLISDFAVNCARVSALTSDKPGTSTRSSIEYGTTVRVPGTSTS